MPGQGAARWRRFVVGVLLPALLAVALFGALIGAVILPEFERNLLERKREMIRELTRSAWSILAEGARDEAGGVVDRAGAQAGAIARVRDLRYGADRKDYFWIIDTHPRMVMHPFRPEMEGRDLSDYRDPQGKRLFVEAVAAVRERGAGYVDYVWQWKDDPGRLAPKESYVMAFQPWGWIIGTGLYTDDVRAEIGRLTSRVLRLSLAIAAGVLLILGLIVRESLRSERRRHSTEEALRESHERYRALVEASTEGTMMVLDGRCTYSNPTMRDMLGYDAEALASKTLPDLLESEGPGAAALREHLAAVQEGRPAPAQVEGRLRRRDGAAADVLLSVTRFDLGGRAGLILVARDIGRRKEMEAELDRSRERYRALRDTIDIGVFRTTARGPVRLVEANAAARRIFGLGEGEDPAQLRVLETCFDPEDRRALLEVLEKGEPVRSRTLRLRRRDGTTLTTSLSAVLVRDETGAPLYCDALVQDVTGQARREAEREALIEEMQSSLRFLDQPVRLSMLPAVECRVSTPVDQAAALMTQRGATALLVTAEGAQVGIVTDRDLRARVVAARLEAATPVHRVMSAPVASVAGSAPVYEALLAMREHGTQHLGVRDEGGRIAGLVRQRDLLQLQHQSTAVVVREIRAATSGAQAAAARERLALLVGRLVEWGTRPATVARAVTAAVDAATQRAVELAVREAGPAPVPYAFLGLGGQGRFEQTLLSDQDNAILYADPPPERAKEAGEYFLALGAKVTDWLREAGWVFCEGEAMARNPRWSQPLSRWREYFDRWIRDSTPQDLLQVNMFFDFRCVQGEPGLAAQLRGHIRASLRDNPPFFLHLARNALLYKPPVGLFGRIAVDSGGGHAGLFPIKESLLPVVNFARLYALQNDVEDTSTTDRVETLHRGGVLTRSSRDEILDAWSFLMRLRLRHQAQLLAASAAGAAAPPNHLDPRSLTEGEMALLRRALAQVGLILKKISFDFLGTA